MKKRYIENYKKNKEDLVMMEKATENEKSELKNNVVWYIEKDVFDGKDEYRLSQAIARAGHERKWIKYEDKLIVRTKLKPGVSVFHGSINMAKSLEKYGHYVSAFPLLWSDWQVLKCSSYMPSLRKLCGDVVLNNDYSFIPWIELKERNDLFDNSGNIFIKPDTNDKLFAAAVVKKDDFEQWYKQNDECYSPQFDAICLVSSPKEFYGECRFIVIENESISHSYYGDTKPLSKDEELKAYEFVSNIAKTRFLESLPAYAIDVCFQKSNGFKVVEVGGFNTSAWYDCDYDLIIEKASKLATREYKEYEENLLN